MSSLSDFFIFVYTGDRKYAGTDHNVYVKLHTLDGQSTKDIYLNNYMSNNFKRDGIDTFRLTLEDVEGFPRFAEIHRVEIWKERPFYNIFSDDWFVHKIVVENGATNTSFQFPFFRWVKTGYHYNIKCLDTALPQFEEFKEQREMELEQKRESYQYDQKFPNGPVQVKNVPPDEQFAFDYKFDILKSKIFLSFVGKISKLTSKKWTKLDDIAELFKNDAYKTPESLGRWKDDEEFARKRIASINPVLISLLKAVPSNFPVTDDLLKPLLEGLTIQDAIRQKRLFLCDLKILEGIPHKAGTTLCAPMALFFTNKNKTLMPVAIQLFQKPGPENPIFTPKDDPMLWLFVKMWYNNADAAYHQALTHLGMTHLIMEGIDIAANRTLSPSHPVYKLLAPHFLYIIAINAKALQVLVAEGGWIDKTMTFGSKGILELTKKGFDNWRMNVNGLMPEDMKERGLDDPKVLPDYYYREDGLLLFHAIKNYVTSYLKLYYTTEDLIKTDTEIQNFASELVKERGGPDGGVGIKGVPGNGKLERSQDLIDILTSIIFASSVAHASANFGQYDELAYPPNYPSMVKGKPPTSKSAKITETMILESLVDSTGVHDILTVTTILSSKGTNSLGDFEVQYVYDPKARAVVEDFRKDLQEISKKIKIRNETRRIPYDDLLPEDIPNSISI